MLVITLGNKKANNIRLAHASNELANIIDNKEAFD